MSFDEYFQIVAVNGVLEYSSHLSSFVNFGVLRMKTITASPSTFRANFVFVSFSFAEIFAIFAAAGGRSSAPGRPAGRRRPQKLKKRMVELLDGRPVRPRFGVRFDLNLASISI